MSISAEIDADWSEIAADAAVTATYGTGGSILGVLTYEDDIDERRPVLQVAQADMGAVAQGTRLTIGSQVYKVEGYQPTARRLARLLLRKTT